MKIHNKSEESINDAIGRLASFFPSTTDEYGHQLLDYIILDCASDFGTTIVSPKDVKKNISDKLLLEFAEDEIIASAKRLVSKKLVKIIDASNRFDKPKFQILDKAETQVNNNRKTLDELEKKVFDTWEKEVVEKYNNDDIIKKNAFRLRPMLQSFLSQMFIKHGVESVSLLYPGENKVKKWLKENSNDDLKKIIPEISDFFKNVVKIEIPKFFVTDNQERQHYISNLFNSSFFWHLIQVDEECSKLLSKSTIGQKLFLDNNILYSIVGLHGQDALQSAHAMLKFAKDLKYDLVVTTKTLDEFQNTLRWQLNETRQSLPVSSSLAKLALVELGANNFLTVYWNKLVSSCISIEEFVAELGYIEDVLENLRIGIYNKFRKDIEHSEELSDEMSTLRKACGDHINIHIIEHDAFHRVLINKLRKGHKYNFKEAKAWFLTHDHKLPQYSKYARQGNAHLPFCITTNEWIQINRPLLTRTKTKEEYERSFYLLVTQSYVRSMLPSVPMDKVFNKVLGKLDRYKGMTPEIASRIASNSHFMISILNIDDDYELDSKIENKLIDLNKELSRENEALKLTNKGRAKEAEKLEKKLEEILEKHTEQIKAQEVKISKLESVKYSVVDNAKNLHQELEEERRKSIVLDSKLKEQYLKDKLLKWKIPAYLSLIGVFIVLLLVILTFAFQNQQWNSIANFFEWAEKQSELRKEILKWLIVLVLALTQSWSVSLIWKRLISTNEKEKITKKLNENYAQDKL
jgi:hypothetical protein